MNLYGENVYLRYFRFGDEHELAQFHLKNRDYFAQFAASREEQYFTVQYQKQLIQQFISDHFEDARYCFGIFLSKSHQFIGVISLSDVARGPLQSAYLGYCLDKSQSGNGYTSEAVSILVDYAFTQLQLHRIEANVMPANLASIRVLEKTHFVQEGLCKKNIKINGIWEDHYMYARLNDE